MKKGFKIAVAVALVIIVVAASALIYLVYPGTPSRSNFMTFRGFIELPQTGRLNVLDYLTLRDHVLFVTSESSGKVFQVTLDPTTQTTAVNISTLAGGGAVHGVVLIPSQNVALVTRPAFSKSKASLSRTMQMPYSMTLPANSCTLPTATRIWQL
jgi:hypothetical protein